MLGSFGPLEILVVLIIAPLVLRPRRIPGLGLREFRDSLGADWTAPEGGRDVSPERARAADLRVAEQVERGLICGKRV